MKKVHIKFGELMDDEDHIYVYEDLLEDNIVKLLLPTVSYSMCQKIANDIELPAYIVEGTYIGQANNGQPALKEYKMVSKITLDKYKECYFYNEIKTELSKKEVQAPVELSRSEMISKLPPLLRLFVSVGDMVTPRQRTSRLDTFRK